jgi:hypothetical protein
VIQSAEAAKGLAEGDVGGPIYNALALLDIAGRPAWWFMLLFVPVANFIVPFIVMIGIANAFGKTAGFGVGLVLLSFVFIPILGFGSARYQGVQR